MGRDSFPYDAQLFNRLIVDDTDLRAPGGLARDSAGPNCNNHAWAGRFRARARYLCDVVCSALLLRASLALLGSSGRPSAPPAPRPPRP